MASATEPAHDQSTLHSKIACQPGSQAKALPPLEVARRWLSYDPLTGIIRWRDRRGTRGLPGYEAGRCSPRGYRIIALGGMHYRAHRLAWLLHYGVPPRGQIDHVNGVRDDNRIVNLREATQSQNSANMRIRASNRCGFKGVHRKRVNGRCWRAQITIEKRKVHLGYFDTAEAAGRAYAAAAVRAYGAFARATVALPASSTS